MKRNNFALFVVAALFGALSCSAYDYCQSPQPNPSQDISGKQLKFASVFFRHGDRTPASPLPTIGANDVSWTCSENSLNLFSSGLNDFVNDPHRLYRKTYLDGRNILPGNCMLGQLTAKGRDQHFELGKNYRKLYVDTYNLLGTMFNSKDVWVRSTDIPRTVQSAMANLWQFFPVDTRNNTEVVEIRTLDNALENMIPNPDSCPLYGVAVKNLQNSTVWKEGEAKFSALQHKLQQIFGVTSTLSWGNLADNFFARKCHNLPYPPGITQDLVDQVSDVAMWEATEIFNDNASGLYGMGLFVNEILSVFQEAVSAKNQYKLRVYSGHDTTVGPLAGTLGIYDDVWPPYASHLEIELWQDVKTKAYFVQTKYNGESKMVPSCSGVMCPWTQWSSFVSSRALATCE